MQVQHRQLSPQNSRNVKPASPLPVSFFPTGYDFDFFKFKVNKYLLDP